MLKGVNELRHYTLKATDGDIGSVHDVLFDDEFWIARYVVVDTARWLPGRRVLLTPGVLGQTGLAAPRFADGVDAGGGQEQSGH